MHLHIIHSFIHSFFFFDNQLNFGFSSGLFFLWFRNRSSGSSGSSGFICCSDGLSDGFGDGLNGSGFCQSGNRSH